MHRKRIYIAAGIAAALIVGVAVVAATRSGSAHNAKQAAVVASTSTTSVVVPSSPSTTATSAPSPTTTLKDVVPVEHTFRSPLRCEKPGAPTVGTLPNDSAANGKHWTTVKQLQGACDLSSSSFDLKGIDTRLVWRSDAQQFAAFLLDSKTGLEGTAGFADAECAGPCADFQSLTNQAGTYTLRVQADGGPWQLLVQEYR